MGERVFEVFRWENSPSRIDRAESVLRGVKILGLESRNGRIYPIATLQAAAALYEGAKVNVDHPARKGDQIRQYSDRIGSVRNVTAKDDGLFADFHFNPKHRMAEQLLWDAEKAPGNVGFSHNVLAKTRREGEQVIVESILQVSSVDLVADPATTSGLFEHNASLAVPEDSFEAELRSNLETSVETKVDSALCSMFEALVAKLDVLSESIRLLTQETSLALSREEVERKIACLRLPPVLESMQFREACFGARNAEQLEKLLEIRREDIVAMGCGRRPRSIEQNVALGRSSSDSHVRDFAAAIR